MTSVSHQLHRCGSSGGYFNTLIRSTANNVLGVYQVKGTTITSLVVTGKKATIRGNVSIFDVTTGSVLVDGSATFEVLISDNGEPGTADTIAVTIRNGAGTLWFCSNWASAPVNNCSGLATSNCHNKDDLAK